MKKTVLITGASRGIGMRAAQQLTRDGHRVFATMRDPDGANKERADYLRDWAERDSLDLSVVELDVTDGRSVTNAVNSIERAFPIDFLVNNAGVMPVGVTEAFSEEQWHECMEVNLFGLVRVTRAVLPFMRSRRGGTLIHLSSTAGRLAIPFFGVYCASKWAMEAFCESLHHEIDGFGIDSVLVEPSGHATDLVKTSPRPHHTEIQSQYGALSLGGDRMLGMFEAMFAEGNEITDAENVAAAIASLVRSEGPLPLRVCVGADMGVGKINERIAPIQAELIDALSPVYAGTIIG